MPDENARQRLNHYLQGAREDAIGDAGKDWQQKGKLLQVVSDALRNRGPELAERLGKDSQTAEQLRQALLTASVRMQTTSSKLADAGDALVVVGDNIEKARAHRKAMKSLVEPPAFVEPTYAGAQPTPEEILDAANKRAASNKEHGDYRAASAGQEADAAEITSKLDEAFLSAIPPMLAIHGGPDPTKRNKNDRGGFTLVQTSETEAERRRRRRRERAANEERKELERLKQAEYERREQAERDRAEAERERLERERQERLERERAEREQRERDRLERERLERQERERQDQERRDRERHPYTPTPVVTTNVQGETAGGTTYQVADSSASTSTHSSTPASASASSGSTLGSSLGVGAAVAGAGGAVIRAGGAISGGTIGGTIGGVVSATPSGSVSAGTSSAAIGAGSRSGAPGSLGGATGTAGSPIRASGSAPGSAGAPGAARSTNGKGGAKGRGLFRRGPNGSTTGGRGNKKNDEQADQRDALVYDQDWLGDDSAAPGVLD